MKPGDLVTTNGGPPMTVEVVDGDHVQCAWFEGCEQRRQNFPAGSLAIAPPEAAVITGPPRRVKVRWNVAHHGFAAGVGDVTEISADVARRQAAAGNVEILDGPPATNAIVAEVPNAGREDRPETPPGADPAG